MLKKNVTPLFLLFLLAIINLNANQAKLPPLFSTPLFLIQQQDTNVFYNSGTLYVKGLKGSGKIQIFSIIGNKLHEEDVIELENAEIPVNLQSNNVYIVRVIFSNSEIKTFKIIASY